ncbi:hypothetical protein AMAG_13980 [Allomyces macrogynus ATCC 38327]|uniref:Uncharacterized protein n=1 Tax=Allomyces macrogynus (strain ATCC 38327) TaxID=578462 RepID=A0A0L0T2P2_ALLM3|nr:hypothetical protein AMAG_13980 [Allomyces macrogynus ATCC 38327]|eukprot:KNE69123.1 hypothetical protein AMAG_13980 [Allomyces macrogynus ATCC 38327]
MVATTTSLGLLGKRLLVLAMDDSVASQVALAWTLKEMVHPERDHLTSKRELKADARAQRICEYAAMHIGDFVKQMSVPLSFELVTLKAADNDRYVHLALLAARPTPIHALRLAVTRAILGSTSSYCLHHAAVPVIIVKEEGGVKAG